MSPFLLSIKAFFVTQPLAAAATVVATVGVVSAGAVGQSLLAPVSIGEDGNYQSSALFQNYTANVNFRNDEFNESFDCDNSGCLTGGQYGVPDGEYIATYRIFDFLGREVSVEERFVIVDTVPPEITVDVPTQTNQRELEVSFKSNELVSVYVNGEFMLKDEEGKIALTVDQDEVMFRISFVDKGGNEVADDHTIRFDEEITLDVTSPTDGQEVEGSFIVAGKTDPGSKITASGSNGTADENGDFSFSANYSADAVEIVSTDPAGNTATKTVTVKRKPAPAPTAGTVRGQAFDYSFTYPAWFGAPQIINDGGSERVRFSGSPTSHVANIPMQYPVYSTETISEEAGPATANGYSSKIVVYKILENFAGQNLFGKFLVMGTGTQGNAHCPGFFTTTVDTIEQANTYKAVTRNLLATLRTNYPQGCPLF